ncbi:MAG: Ig-like domain-containing protein [Bacteroidota bacterium]
MSFHEEVSPRIVGSMPRDGAEGIIRNAFIAVGLDVGKDGLGLDIETVNEENIKLYPQHDPTSLIKSFVASSQIPLNITVEPLHVLAPNTTYVFEISDSLKDMAGRNFPAFRITFTTSEISQPKFISMKRSKPKRLKGFRPKDDPNILPAGPKLYAEPKEQAIAHTESPTEATPHSPESNTPLAESKPSAKQPIHEAQQDQISKETNPPAVAQAASPPKPEMMPTQTNAEQKEAISMDSPQAKPVGKPDETTDENKPIANTESVANTEIVKESKPKAESIDFPKSRVKSGTKLPIAFLMHQKRGIKYMIKNPAGKIVKRGTSTLKAGHSGKGIDVSTLPPGRYRISVKVEEKIVHHTFVILK